MIKTCCHDTVCPQPLGSQLIHLPAGGDGVAASHHPVVGGRGHNHPDPPHKTADKSSQVQAGGHHLCPWVGRAGQDRGQPGGIPAAGAAGMGFGRMRSLVRLCCKHSAASAQLPPWEGSELPPAPQHGRSKGGAPTSARASGGRGVWRGGDARSHPASQRGLFKSESLSIQNLAQREKY